MNDLFITTTRRALLVCRIVRLLGAVTTVAVAGALVVPTSSGCQCAALCVGTVSAVVRNPANAPDAIFEACSRTCTSFRIDGGACVIVKGHAGDTCTLSSDGLEAKASIDAEDEDDVTLTVKSGNGAVLIFEDSATVDGTELEVCGDTCYEGEVTFTIPP